MNVPVQLALPAAVAGMAYLNAKHNIASDLYFIKMIILAEIQQKRRDKSGLHNMWYTFEAHALNAKTADRMFLIYETRQWTYRQAYDTVLRYGQYLKQTFAIRPNEVVALDCTNKPEFLWYWLGLWHIGARPALINFNLTDQPLLQSVKSSAARLLLVDEEVQPAFPQNVLNKFASDNFLDGKGSTEVVFFGPLKEQEILAFHAIREPDSVRANVNGESMAMLIYTSGTTGLPKPAVINWNKLNRVRMFFTDWLGLKPDDVFFTCMPLYHSAASILAVCTVIPAGCTLALGHRFGTHTFWPEVRKTKATVIQYVGETCRYLLSPPPSPLDSQNSVRMAFGNGLRPDIWNEFKMRFDIKEIAEIYGATEGTGGTYNRSRNDFTLGAMGRAGSLLRTLFGGRSALVPHDYATEMPARDLKTGFCPRINTWKAGAPAGELLYKLPEMKEEIDAAFPGYYRNEKATSSKVLRNVFEKGDAWFRTGDVVRTDVEGRQYFHDRIGDTFRWKGENVSTNEVSEVLGRHPAIAEANVYGVQLPRHDGRAGCVAVVLKGTEGGTPAEVSKQLLMSLAETAQKGLPRYALPLFLRFTSTMQTTGTNKQMKSALRSEGVDPSKAGGNGDRLFWLLGNTYEPFGEKQWKELEVGNVKL